MKCRLRWQSRAGRGDDGALDRARWSRPPCPSGSRRGVKASCRPAPGGGALRGGSAVDQRMETSLSGLPPAPAVVESGRAVSNLLNWLKYLVYHIVYIFGGSGGATDQRRRPRGGHRAIETIAGGSPARYVARQARRRFVWFWSRRWIREEMTWCSVARRRHGTTVTCVLPEDATTASPVMRHPGASTSGGATDGLATLGPPVALRKSVRLRGGVRVYESEKCFAWGCVVRSCARSSGWLGWPQSVLPLRCWARTSAAVP